jgi:hypothetical protein
VNKLLGRHLIGLDHAIALNEALLQDTTWLAETNAHLRALRAEAATAARQLGPVDPSANAPAPSRGPSF